MSLQNKQFPVQTMDEWKETVRQSLKGKEWTTLQTETIEGVTLDPLYTELTEAHQQQVHAIRSHDKLTTETNFIQPLTHVDVDARIAHKQGADAVTELVSFLLLSHDFVEKNGSYPKQAAFAVDTHFFMEIAKLRAVRLLWNTFQKAHHTDNEPLSLYAETSLRSFSLFDPHVNLLRSANSAFSAVLAGADELAIHPFDVLTGATTLGKRLAENSFEVIRQESYVMAVSDSAGGTFSIESLTHQLADAAWQKFVELIDQDANSRSEWVIKQSEVAFETLLKQTSVREHSLIGTTAYANPHDQALPLSTDLGYSRLASPFENLRLQLQPLSHQVAIIQAGEFKSAKARMDFVRGFLSTFGWDPQIIKADDQLQSQLDTLDIRYAVISGQDIDSEQVDQSVNSAKVIVDIAGNHPQLEEWKQQGINGSIYFGQSLLEKGQELKNLLTRQEASR